MFEVAAPRKRKFPAFSALSVWVWVASWVWGWQANGQTFPIGPGGQDSHIDSRSYGPTGDRRGLDFGSETRMKIGHTDRSNSNYTIGLVQFDLNGTPASGVGRAWVSLAIDPDTSGAGSPAMVTVHAIKGAWDQGTVTWKTSRRRIPR
jgi:hypothetical protein